MLTFIEIGSGHYGALTPLLEKNWHQVASQKLQEGHQNRFPVEVLSYSGEWEGYFVEPSPMRCATLIEDHSWRKNVHFIQGALSSETRFTQIHLIETKVPSVQIRPPKHFIGKFSLQTFTLDDLLDFLDLTPTLLFMDIEFEEMDVLETYSFSRLPDFWMVDMHHHEPSIQKAIHIFEKNGYKILTTTGHPVDQDELWVQKRQY